MEIQITFQPGNRTVYVLPGTTILEAAGRAGIIINTPCGGIGVCGKCLVQITEGNSPASEQEDGLLTAEQIDNGFRLACCCLAASNLTVEIPGQSLFETGVRVLSRDAEHGQEAEAINLTAEGHGVAFDIGTTTIVGTLIDLSDGTELAVSGRINPQTSLGDDVISRIKRCIESGDGLVELNSAILEGVHDVLETITREAGVEPESLRRAVFAGNSAMQEILCNINPRALGEIPFTPAFTEPQLLSANAMGLSINPEAEVFIFPQVGGFVGGDTVAGVIATRLDKQEGPVFFIDIGTNGELVLADNGRLTAASTAAGPAFEGARIIDGMRAAAGAIEKIVIDDDITFNVIGNVKPIGLCGSALIDVVAQLLELGVIDNMGRILEPDELPAEVPDAIRNRLVQEDGHCNFVLVNSAESGSGNVVCLYQKDVRELQLANGAIRAGIRILLKTNGLEAADLKTVFVAGAFGNFIRLENASRIGLLPRIPAEKVKFVGNTASLGAKLALLSREERVYATRIGEEMEHVDLSTDPDFQDEFGSAMIFP